MVKEYNVGLENYRAKLSQDQVLCDFEIVKFK